MPWHLLAVPVLAIGGMTLFLAAPGLKFQEIGKIMFWVGLSGTMLALIR